MTDYDELFGADEAEQAPPTEITDEGTLAMLRALDTNRTAIERLEEENKEFSGILVERLSGQDRLLWRDALNRLRPVRVNKPSVTYDPSPIGLAWLQVQYPATYEAVTSRELNIAAYNKARRQGLVTDQMHEKMIARDDEGNPVPTRTRRGSVVLPAARENADASA